MDFIIDSLLKYINEKKLKEFHFLLWTKITNENWFCVVLYKWKKNWLDFCSTARYSYDWKQPHQSFKIFNQCLRCIYKFSCFYYQFFIATFRFCAILGVTETPQQRHMWNESAVRATFVTGVFRRVLSSLLPVVLIHLRHGGELRFTLVQSVVWALLETHGGHVECDERQQGGWRTGTLLSMLHEGMVQFNGKKEENKKKKHTNRNTLHTISPQ